MPPVHARRVVVTCYDLIPRRFPLAYLANITADTRYRNRLAMLTAADAIVTDSQSAADDAAEFLGIDRRRMTVIGAGVGPGFVPPTTTLAARVQSLTAEIPGIQARFVLVPTGMDWRKNTMPAVEAYARLPVGLRDRHQLVLACRLDDHHRQQIDAQCERLGVSGRVLVTDLVSDDTLVLLYQSAELVFFPSVHEGFGLPVLEARRCGARVICANTSALPEVLPEPEAWFNPFDVADMATVIERALTDVAFIARLGAVPDPGFDWPETARRLAAVYRAELGRIRPHRSHDRRRLAVVSPLPPAHNGVANHTDRLLEAIFREVDDVDVVAYVPWGKPGVVGQIEYPVRELDTLPDAWAAGDIDAVLYCVGNHVIHRRVLPMLERVPGHVLIHDARLIGALDPSRRHRHVEAAGLGTDALCIEPFAERALSVLVQSEFAASALAGAGIAATDVGPHHVPVVEAVPLGKRDGGLPWVVTAGVADRTKRTGVFVDAARRLVAAGSARAAVVGPLGERFVGADGAVEATGWVPDDELGDWLARADVVVALRDETNGESSGIVADAMARGCAVVVSDVGAMSELPDDAVVKVAADVDATDLARVVTALLADAERRSALANGARSYARRNTPLQQARRIVEAVFDAL